MCLKRMIAVALCLVTVLLFCACGKQENGAVKGQGNDLWAEASPETSALEFCRFYGDSGKAGHLFAQEDIQQILSELSGVDAKPAEDWTPKKFRVPAFGIEIGTKDGMGIQAAWSNGYLILRDGSVYAFDYDFAALEDYSWNYARDIESASELPCGRYFALWNGQWYPEQLDLADEKETPDGVSMAITAQTAESITVQLQNDTDTEWLFGEYFSLEVCLDGVWYVVPTTPEQNWGFNSIGYILLPGDSREMEYKLMSYGDLPAGDYRLVVEDLTAEFSVQYA